MINELGSENARSTRLRRFNRGSVDALMMLIFDQRRQLARVDESRRMQESLGEDYHKFTYYERWLQAVSWLMLEKSVFTQEELDAKQAEVRARLEAERDAV